MQDLNKQQLILLALLVSFVTSIATGIVTVTLLDQAPKGVTKTINRVVERTVETVVPGETKVVEKIREVDVSPTEEELVVAAIGKAEPALVRVALSGEFSTSTDATTTPPQLSSGFFISSDGYIATVADGLQMTKDYSVRLSDGAVKKAKAVFLESNDNLAILKINPPEASAKSTSPLSVLTDAVKRESFPSLSLSRGDVILGQTVISIGIGGNLGKTVALGIISGIRSEATSTTSLLHTNIEAGTDNLGGPLMSLQADLVGILVDSQSATAGSKSTALPTSVIKKALDSLKTVSEGEGGTGEVAGATSNGS